MTNIETALSVLVILGYLISLSLALKFAHYEAERNRKLLRSNRELHSENQYFRNNYIKK